MRRIASDLAAFLGLRNPGGNVRPSRGITTSPDEPNLEIDHTSLVVTAEAGIDGPLWRS